MTDGFWMRSDQASKFFGVHPGTLRRWADNGTIVYKRTVGGQRLYSVSNPNVLPTQSKKVSYVYARVSSSKQKDDLQRQIEMLQDKHPDYLLVKDIASGLNFKRRGLLKLLDLSNKGLVESIVVTSKDRLCRFGFDLLEWQLEQNNVKLVVLDKTDKSPEEEFTEDILAVLQVFACRWNGKRRYTFKNKKDQVTVDITSDQTTSSLETHL